MNIYTVCAAAVCFTCIGGIIKETKKDYLPLFVCACGLVLGGYIVSCFLPITEYLRSLVNENGGEYFEILFKAVGVSLICRIASDVCRDCGENSLASKVELAGKVSIVTLSLPLVRFLLETSTEFLNS